MNMMNSARFHIGVVLAILMTGCGGAYSVNGGTPGELNSGGTPLSDIRVTVHQKGTTHYKVVGFAETRREGDFELLKPKGDGPLYLATGEYCCTLASTGTPFPIPKEYSQPETTPPKLSWKDEDGTLELEVPPPKPKR